MEFRRIFVSTLLKTIVGNKILRGIALKKFESWLYEDLIVKNPEERPIKVQEDKYIGLSALLHSVLRNMDKGYISKDVAFRMIDTLVKGAFLKGGREAERKFEEKYGYGPPAFITISPTKACNLRCAGCYASSSATTKDTLEFDIVDEIVRQAHELWGARFMVISGGEPLLYKSQGKTILDLFEKYDDMFFLMYTNGTLIDENIAKRMAELGNITPAISVEGLKKETEERRGRGVFEKILSAFENLREAGVPFGASVTATRKNIDILLTDEFYDFYFEEQGCSYMWIFHYMPIGRDYNISLMPTPKERVELFRKWKDVMKNKRYFVADFWNSGTLANGCIAFARPGGYFYIDWHGNIMPCVFVPYYKDNVKELFAKGKNLNDAIMSDFFKKGREWQFRYALMRKGKETGNLLMPCSIRDHYENFRRIADEVKVRPEDEEAAKALKDKKYYQEMVKFDKELAELTDKIWKEEYLSEEEKKAV